MKTLATFLALCLVVSIAQAGWLDKLFGGGQSPSNIVTAAAALSEEEITKGLKEALATGTEKAIANLGKTNGFLNNLEVKIPMPQKLQEVDKGLRMIGQGRYADEFVATMNHAAETAVPEAGAIFADAIRGMTLADAKNILGGPDDAATQYFRKTGEPRLREKMLPIVQTATEKAGVTAAYKNLTGKAGFMASFLEKEGLDVDKYVTDRALDGLFKMIAVEEKEIRTNPMARGTDLLQKVFGSVTRK
jgi:hypothetical protein